MPKAAAKKARRAKRSAKPAGFPHKEHGILYLGLLVVLLVALLIVATPETSAPEFVAPIMAPAGIVFSVLGDLEGTVSLGKSIELGRVETDPAHPRVLAGYFPSGAGAADLILTAEAFSPGGDSRIVSTLGRISIGLFYPDIPQTITVRLETDGEVWIARDGEFVLAGRIAVR